MNDASKVKLYAAISGVVATVLLVMTIAFAIAFGGGVGWPMFILFSLFATAGGSLALYAWYLNGWY